MSRRTDNLRNSLRAGQAKSPASGRPLRVVAAVGASMVAAAALAGCVNSNLLDPPALFERTAASSLPLDCGGGKGDVPTSLLMCGDANVASNSPITLTIYSPFAPASADSLEMTLTILDAHGELVRRVQGMRATPGYITEVWNLDTDAGAPAPSGDYRIYVKMSNQTIHGDVSLFR